MGSSEEGGIEGERNDNEGVVDRTVLSCTEHCPLSSPSPASLRQFTLESSRVSSSIVREWPRSLQE